MIKQIPALIIAVFLILLIHSCNNKEQKNIQATSGADETVLDFTAVHLLIDLIHVIEEQNQDYEQILAGIELLPKPEQEKKLDQLIALNKENKQITEKIDNLLESDAYKFYYKKFHNITPDIHREIFYQLPYRSIPSPAGVSGNYYDLCRYHEELCEWLKDLDTNLDIEKSYRTALNWLPDTIEYTIPKIYFIYDGNGDAFVKDGKVCFDIYGSILSSLPRDCRYDSLGKINIECTEKILAHEFHHIFADPLINKRKYDVFYEEKKKWFDRITCRLVSEGMAMLCNPPEGIKREIMEDPLVVGYWVHEFNQKICEIDDGTITEKQLCDWLDGTYHHEARDLLRSYLAQNYDGEELDQKEQENVIYRPVMIYTLGWWMVNNIVSEAGDSTEVIKLLSEPDSIYEHYNRTIKEKAEHLVIAVT